MPTGMDTDLKNLSGQNGEADRTVPGFSKTAPFKNKPINNFTSMDSLKKWVQC